VQSKPERGEGRDETAVKYQFFDELPGLADRGFLRKRPHATLPLDVYNYTVKAQYLPGHEWSEALKDCRGLILDREGHIVGRPFRKFWEYRFVLSEVPAGERFHVWEKLDGSLGIVCSYEGRRIAATRGRFDSAQALWLAAYLDREHPDFLPADGMTWLFEIVYPANRLVVDYGDTAGAFLLAVLDRAARDLWPAFDQCVRFRKARRFEGIADFTEIDSDPRFAGREGFVVQWESGMRAKVKLAEYRRLHRLITELSTRTIWEMLRTGQDTSLLVDRVPADFEQWVKEQIAAIGGSHAGIMEWAREAMRAAPPAEPRSDFARWVKQQKYPKLLFSLADGRDIADVVWKMVEPKGAITFRDEGE
jgi:RNA ligase